MVITENKLSSIKNLLVLSAKQRKLCKRLKGSRDQLFRMAYAWSHRTDIADEIVQEAMIKALNSVDKVKNIDTLDSWMFRILSNCFIDFYRKQRKEIDIDDVLLVEYNCPEIVHGQDEMLALVRSAIASLPFKHRQVITLVDLEEFSYAEVANILDIPQGTVMSRLNRARQTLKKILNELKTNNQNRTRLKVV
ncbi:MAG: RNA polymerase subunit sigma-24 [Thiotrichaceae bacterium]|nr:MAG: RNA polymerase subunit sigma-24 [Thiotrichaceae bacterium]